MTAALRLPALAAALALLPAAARAAEPPPVAFLGLRPTEDRSFGPTAIGRIAEAQRLRVTVESVLEALSGARVLGHDQVRALLGRSYLVDHFECKGEPACLLRVASPLRAGGATTALAADAFEDGAVLRVRVRRLDLVRDRVADEVVVEVPRADAGSLAAWRAALAPLFADTGAIRLVVSQPDAQCLLDGKPCAPGPDGLLADVPEGEHLLAVAREGFKRAERVVQVRRGEQLRVAVALEQLPVQAQTAPDPAARVPTFEAPSEETKVKLFGSLRLALLVDDVDAGEREDPAVPPGVKPGGASLVALPRPVVLGVAIQAPRHPSGWQTRGALSLAWVKDSGPEIDSAFSELVQEELGFRLMLGWGPSIVSGLTAGTLTFPEGFGDLSFGGVGVTASKSLGPLLLELFVGKHKAQFSPSTEPSTTSPAPMVGAHAALVDKERTGTLYGEEYPLTVGLSALYGQEKVGIGDEAAWASGAGLPPPVKEQVAVWVASLEAFVPLGKQLGLAGEAWVGQDVRLLEGSLWQPPRLDAVTGRHTPLRSAGGWAQVTWAATEAVELRLVAGTDQAIGALNAGPPVGDVPAVRSNRLLATNGSWRFGPLSLGLQLHAIRTRYQDPAQGGGTLLGCAFTSLLRF